MFEAAKVDMAPTTRVDHVYPSADVLPDNQLKFYLHFSAPMRRGEAWQHIHLLKQDGQPVQCFELLRRSFLGCRHGAAETTSLSQ